MEAKEKLFMRLEELVWLWRSLVGGGQELADGFVAEITA